MRLGAVATRRQYLDHLAPIFEALGAAERVPVVTGTNRPRNGRSGQQGPNPGPPEADRWLVAATRDLEAARLLGARAVAYMDHGVGLQWFKPHRLRQLAEAALILAPNDFLASRYAEALPGVPLEVIGTPKLDALPRDGVDLQQRPAVGLSFHWTGITLASVPPPARFEAEIADLARRYEVIGHAHPNVWREMAPWYAERGIEPVEDFASVIDRASVYACDHSSTIYEWAALDRPVVLLDHEPGQRLLCKRSTGLRYQHLADVGIHAAPGELVAAVERAWVDEPAVAERRREITDELYPHRGRAVARAIEALRGMRIIESAPLVGVGGS